MASAKALLLYIRRLLEALEPVNCNGQFGSEEGSGEEESNGLEV